MADSKLNRETLSDQVAQAVQERIQVEHLQPGDPLPSISVLAEDFGVSRPVIREALKTLEGREIIEVSNGRSAIVKPMTSSSLKNFFERAIALNKESFLELLELRRGIEIQCVILAATRRSAEEAAQLQSRITVMRACLEDPAEYTQQDVDLHFAIASATHNSLMYYLVESIRDTLHSTIKRGIESRKDLGEIQLVQKVHEEIVDAVVKGDPDEAARAMSAHFDDAMQFLGRIEIP